LVDVEIGNYYIITYIQPITNNEITEIVKVEMPHSIENDNLTTKEGIKIIGYRDLKNRTLTKIVPYNKFGNDLQSYKVTFSDGRNFY